MQSPLLMLLDSASLYFRAFYGIPDRRVSPTEPPVNAVRGFIDMVTSLIRTYHPTHLVACWDEDWRPDFRVSAIPTYKAHRVAADGGEQVPAELAAQVPVIIDVLAAIGLARVGAPGYEADDIIGSLVAVHRAELPIDIVTGDRDLFQLIDDAARVRVLYTARGGVRSPDIMNQQRLLEKYQVPTGAAYLDMSVLRGDPSDGLPGVKGIGPKTAASLVQRYGSLANILAAVANGDPDLRGAQRTRLEDAGEYLAAAPRVVRVAPDAPLGDLAETSVLVPATLAHPDHVARLSESYGLASEFSRLATALAANAG